MALQAFHHASVKLGQLSDLDDLLGFHQGKPQLRRGVRGDKVSPRRYEKTTYLQKANAKPPQHRKVMGLQRAATGDGPRLLRTPDRQQPNPKKGAKATKIPEPENFGKFRQKNFDTPLPVQRVADAPFSRAVGLTIGRGGHKMGRALAPPPQRTDPIEGAPPSRGGNRPEDADQGDDGDTNGGHEHA